MNIFPANCCTKPNSSKLNRPVRTAEGDSLNSETSLSICLGSADKFVTGSEQETYILQRRCMRAAREIKAGEKITIDMVEPLRPASKGAVMPWEIDDVIGKSALIDMPFGMDLRWENIGP